MNERKRGKEGKRELYKSGRNDEGWRREEGRVNAKGMVGGKMNTQF